MYHNISIPFQGHRKWPLNITNSRNNCLKVCTNTKEKTREHELGWLRMARIKTFENLKKKNLGYNLKEDKPRLCSFKKPFFKIDI